MSQTAVLLSIKPKYADLIFSGEKTIELRRVCPKVKEGDLVLVYASGPRMALIGGFEVENIISEECDLFYEKHGDKTGVSEKVFNSYFEGVSQAYGIKIRRTWRLSEETELKTLRRKVKGFHPPQSYRYLRGKEMPWLIALASE